MLRASRDGEPAAIWHDNGESVQALANTAGVRVTFVHVDLTAQTTAPARPDWLPPNVELDKQFLGEAPSAPDTISRLYNAYKGSREAISKFGAL
jgi:hypothetical protein